MPEWTGSIIYLLCLISSAICAALLVRSYRRNHTALLLWSAACFVLLALNNLALVFDILVFPAAIDLSMVRTLLALAGVCTLLYGFIWEAD